MVAAVAKDSHIVQGTTAPLESMNEGRKLPQMHYKEKCQNKVVYWAHVECIISQSVLWCSPQLGMVHGESSVHLVLFGNGCLSSLPSVIPSSR